jgi:outer membrane receptor protein involved in Fe transport
MGTVTIGGMAATTGVDATMYGQHRVWESALYLQDEAELTSTIRISGGGRLDLHSTDATPTRVVFSPKAALINTPARNVVLRLTAGRGFRAPSVAETFISAATSGFTVIPNLELEPETMWSGEVGGSWMPLAVVRIEGSLFLNRYSSMIEGVRVTGGDIQFRNLHRARLQGAELALQATHPDGWLRGAASYLWLSTRNLDNGSVLAYRRPKQGSITVEVMGSWWSFATDLLYGATMGRTAVYVNDRRIPFYRIDGRLSARFKGMRVIMQGRNLTEYSCTDIERNLSPPREWLISLEWSW